MIRLFCIWLLINSQSVFFQENHRSPHIFLHFTISELIYFLYQSIKKFPVMRNYNQRAIPIDLSLYLCKCYKINTIIHYDPGKTTGS